MTLTYQTAVPVAFVVNARVMKYDDLIRVGVLSMTMDAFEKTFRTVAERQTVRVHTKDNRTVLAQIDNVNYTDGTYAVVFH